MFAFFVQSILLRMRTCMIKYSPGSFYMNSYISVAQRFIASQENTFCHHRTHSKAHTHTHVSCLRQDNEHTNALMDTDRMCSLTNTHVSCLRQDNEHTNALSYKCTHSKCMRELMDTDRMCSLTTECVLFLPHGYGEIT